MTNEINVPVSGLPFPEQVQLMSGRDMWSTAAIGPIPSFKMADGPMGIASGRVDERDISVLTPCGVALGASWDRDLVGRVGALVGIEAQRLGVQMVLAPNLNLPRSPLAGRAFEMYAEDPYLAGALGAAWIGGLQSRGVAACAKHLVCNDSETERHRYDAVIAAQPLREIYLKPFEMAVQAGCKAVMAAYNALNGVPCVADPFLLTRVLREDWAFDGVTVSDWFGTADGAASAAAGLDLEMPGPARCYGPALLAAVESGRLRPTQVAQAAARVARLAQSLPKPATSDPADSDRTLLTEAAAASFVMLRNRDDLLPALPGRHAEIAIIGPNAAHPCYQGGTFAKIALRPDTVTPLAALIACYGPQAEVSYQLGVAPELRLPLMHAHPARDLGDGANSGMTVDYFTDHSFAEPAFSETRNINSLTWFSALPGAGALDQPRGVRASGYFTPERSGPHDIHVGGTGPVRLLVDGVEIHRTETVLDPADVMGVVKAGDSDHVTLQLRAGQPVSILAAGLRRAALLSGPRAGIVVWRARPGTGRDDARRRACRGCRGRSGAAAGGRNA